MKFPLNILIILSVFLWLSALGMFLYGTTSPEHSVLRFAVIPDALAALVFTILAAQKWSRGPD